MAKAVSAATFPLLMPLYAVIMTFTLSYMRLYGSHILVMVTLAVFFLTAVLPAGFICLLYRRGRIAHPALNNREDRLAPFIFTILSYLATAYYLGYIHAPWWMSHFMVGAAAALAVAAVITLRWKISGHALGMGGLTALALFLQSRGLLLTSRPELLPLTVIGLSGLVGTSRLLLGRHTLLQLLAGYALGLAALTLTL